jgi:thiol-disulfide isomerase/thioredoxin
MLGGIRLMTKQRILSFAALAGLSILAGVLVWHVAQVSHDLVEVTATPPHIDQSADTLKQISDALLIAKRDNKRVLLEFGSRGCSWCHLLQKVYETNEQIADELRRNYIVVMVDVSDDNNKTVDDKYGTPRHNSLPFTVILDSEGKPILAQNIAFADEDLLRQNICRIDTDKLLALLKKYSPS